MTDLLRLVLANEVLEGVDDLVLPTLQRRQTFGRQLRLEARRGSIKNLRNAKLRSNSSDRIVVAAAAVVKQLGISQRLYTGATYLSH